MASGIYFASGIGVSIGAVTIGSISGNIITQASGAVVGISGQVVLLMSAEVTIVSGMFDATISGNIVTTRPSMGTFVSSNYTLGIRNTATQLPSVAGFAFVIENPDTNDYMWLGGSAVASGAGYVLLPGATLSPPIDNLSRIYAAAFTSGQRLSWFGVNY
jgi:hypothetical protein